MSKMIKVIPGYVYAVDSKNVFKSTDIPENIILVEVIKRITRSIISGHLWLVRNIKTLDEFECYGKFLHETQEIIVRNPIDMPTISIADITAINTAINTIQEHLGDNTYKDLLDNLKALLMKLNWYYNAKKIDI